MGPQIRLPPRSAVLSTHFFRNFIPWARTAASELIRWASRGRTQHVVRSSSNLSRQALTAGMLAGSSVEMKSSAPSKPHCLMRENSGSCFSPTWVVQTMVFTPNFILFSPFVTCRCAASQLPNQGKIPPA